MILPDIDLLLYVPTADLDFGRFPGLRFRNPLA